MERSFESAGVRGVVHEPDHPTGDALALTHGAGANCHAPLLAALARAFADEGMMVLRYDLPFRQLRPKGPPFPAQAPADRAGVGKAVEALQGLVKGRIFAGGHSYGGRQTAMAAAEQPGLASALLLLSYPLHPPRKPEQMRTAFFPELRTPALFVHGTTDGFGSVGELTEARRAIPAATELLAIEGAGHDLQRAGALAAEILARLRALAGA